MTQKAAFNEGENRPGTWLVVCDHATNIVPASVGNGSLGLSDSEMSRHIAYDPGALGVARALGKALDAPVVWSGFSRLVIDPNRGLDDPTLIMKLYDGTIIPQNARADAAERAQRIASFWQPYHDMVAQFAARPDTKLVSVHSFTPRLKGRAPRPWELGILSAHDRRLADPLIAEAQAVITSPVGDNAPYAGHLPGDCIDQHALAHGRPNVLIELRQDVIETASDQKDWAERLAILLEAARTKANL